MKRDTKLAVVIGATASVACGILAFSVHDIAGSVIIMAVFIIFGAGFGAFVSYIADVLAAVVRRLGLWPLTGPASQ